MLMAASLIAGSGGPTQTLVGAILFYLLVYLFMNLGAFTVVALIAQQTGHEDIRDYAGLTRRSPILAVLLILFLFSLFGMPGLGGFMGKIYLMKSMADAGQMGFVLIAVLLLNTLISLYYYMRPVYYMAFVTDEEDRPRIIPHGAGLAMLFGCVAALLWTGIYPAAAGDMARDFAEMKIVQKNQPVLSSSKMAPGALPTKTVAFDQEDGH